MKKIALVGTAPSGRHAPFNDKSWQIWGVGMRADYVTRADKWFELHRLDGEPPDWAAQWRKHVREWAKDSEIVMLYPEPNLGPNVTKYPHELIVARFGTYFISSSFAWMMALAIDEICPSKRRKLSGEIGLWGIDLEYGTEYRQQRTGLRHFIDLARVLGIKITRLASGGVAYEPVPYPLIQDDPLLQKIALRRSGAEQTLRDLNQSLEEARRIVLESQAIRAEIGKFTNGGYDPEIRLAEIDRQLSGFRQTVEKIGRDIAGLEGEDKTAAWLEDYLRS